MVLLGYIEMHFYRFKEDRKKENKNERSERNERREVSIDSRLEESKTQHGVVTSTQRDVDRYLEIYSAG